MKKELQGMVVGLLIGTLGIGSVAYAKNVSEVASIRYADIKMVVDGVLIQTNSTNEPFIYNGTTYLPVRTVGEALGKEVVWDGNTKTVYIGEAIASDGEVRYGQFDFSDIPEEAVVFDGHYYCIYDFSDMGYGDTWEDAQRYCENVGGYLASITSQEENDFLYQYLREEGYSSAYFGFTDAESEGDWTWANGEAVSYTNWHRGEPNNERQTENYGMFYYKYSDGTWNDGEFGGRTVNDNKVFLCEWGEYEIPS